MKLVKIEVEIPDDATLGPGFCITYLQPPNQLHASCRVNLDGYRGEGKKELENTIREAMANACAR